MEQLMIPEVKFHCGIADARLRQEESVARRKANALEARIDGELMPRKIKPHSPKWTKLALQEALMYAPSIYSCAACEYPVISGFCCTYCSSMNPEGV